MTFRPDQIEALSAPLDRAAVKSRQQGGSQVSYIESYHAENEANRIFGFDAWDRETELTHIGEREQDGKWRVYYRAKVRITVRSDDGGVTVREGCGYGSGIDRDIGAAHESALKEAESDAEKRALKTFGNPFGQALYDKSQAQVAEVESAAVATGKVAIGLCDTVAALEEWAEKNKPMLAGLPKPDAEALRRQWSTRKHQITVMAGANGSTPFDGQGAGAH